MRAAMTLGELTAALRRKDPEASIRFDFVHFVPEGIHSYRGDYAQLAIGYGHGDPKVRDVLAMLEDANGKTFTGYKGGEYEMSDRTEVYVANDNECGQTAIVDVRDDGWCIMLMTEKLD